MDIYLLYSCNEWKEYSSMRLIMASTDEEKIIKQIKKEIRSGDMAFDGHKGKKGVNSFEERYGDYGSLEYGFVTIVGDSQVQQA